MGSPTDLKARLQAVQNNHPSNQKCLDCGDQKPTWASLIVPPIGTPDGSPTLGAFCCFQCSGIHRSLGTHICFVRSVTLDEWKEKEVIAMEQGGNDMVNQIFEHKRKESSSSKLNSKSDMNERKDFIRKKYVDRKYYAAAEYLMAIKRLQVMSEASKKTFTLKQSARDSNKGASRTRGGGGGGNVNPFAHSKPIVSQVSVAKETISDADFFKSMSADDDWLDPFEESSQAESSANQRMELKRRTKKKEDGLSRSWHAQSPTKANAFKPVLDTNKFEDAIQERKTHPRHSTSLMVGNNNAKKSNYLDEDDTVFDSVFTPVDTVLKATDSAVTPRTVTNTSRRRGRKSADPLSTSCHASLSTSSRAKTIDLSRSLHGTSKGGASLFVDRKLSHTTNPAKARPRLMRRMSTNALTTNDAAAATTGSTTPTSDLVVESLLDFVKNNPDVSVDALKTVLTSSNSGHCIDDACNKEPSAEKGAAPARRASRTRRPQRSSSFTDVNEPEKGKTRARSNSRSRTNSRSRRATLIKRVSNANLDDDGTRAAHRPQEQRSYHKDTNEDQQEVKDSAKSSNSNNSDGVERILPFGSSRRKSSSRSRERPSRSRSGSLSGSISGRATLNGSNHGSVPRRNGSSALGRASSASGRRRQLKRSSSSCSDEVTSKLEDTIGSPGAAQDLEIEEFQEFVVQDKALSPDSPTVSEASEASDILDDDDLLIM